LILPIIGIGLYPKIVTQTYDVKTVEVATHARQVLPVVGGQQPASMYSQIFTAPTLASAEVQSLVNISK
jgi:NAD(P)H-quinone oxidoreductase subunit 4